ncbi:catalase isoform X2 [Megachile rotundata]|uniref:catalase isoform X2 n=1 Tax=Megachile rotundata TaxID=143995 RepID=UPI003FD2ABF0
MPKRCSGLIQVVRAVAWGRAPIRNTAPLRVFHSSVNRHDKSPLLLQLTSCYSEPGPPSSALLTRKLILTLAFHRLSLKRYCCKRDTKEDMSETKREPAAQQLTNYKKNARGKCPVLLTGNGVPIAEKKASLTVGPNGPILLQDFVYLDEMSHFARERIPERVVHAKGAGAFGYFEVTHDITRYCKANVFSQVGKKTPIAVRFSTVGGEVGSADTVRDPRGFAVKFYTEDGIWDLVGNNTPIFFIKDPLFFPSFIHTQKRNPVTHLKDADMFWDFITLRPESTHQVMFLFSDRGIPDGYRHMNGYGSHTFKLVNANNEMVYCKFHYKTDQGIKNIPVDKAAELSASDPDYSIRDLYNAIASHNYPTWTFSIQVMTPEQAKSFKWNPFDLTKAISAMNYQRDGLMAIHNQNGAPNYFPNSFSGPQECPAVRSPKFFVSGDVDRYEPVNEDDFGQANLFYNKVLNAEERKRLVNNIVGNLQNASTFLIERAVKNFTQVDADLGKRLTEGLRNVGVKINVFGKTASL